MTGDELYSQYTSYLNFLSLSEETKYQYLRVVDDFLYQSGGNLTRDSVLRYMRKHEPKSGTYRRWIMYILKSLFENAKVEWPFAKRELPKLSKPYQPHLRVADAEKLIGVAKSSPLDHVLVRLDAVTGARRKELSEVLVDDYSRPYIRIRTAKGGEERIRTLDPDTCNAFSVYLKQRRSSSPYMFVSAQGVPLTPQTLSVRFRRLAQQVGFKKGTGWHAVRRGVVTWLFEGGMREREIQELIGWKSIAMVGKYTQLSPGAMEEKATGIHPFFREGDRDGREAGATAPRPGQQAGAKRKRG